MRTYLDTYSSGQVHFSDKFIVMFVIEDDTGDPSILTHTIYTVRKIYET